MKETEKIEIMHFDQEGYLEDGKALYETGKKMTALADKVADEGYDAVFLMGVGGTWDELMQLEYLMNKFGDRDLEVYLIHAAEWNVMGHKRMTEKSVVLTASESGTTPEVLEAVKKMKEKGIRVYAMSTYDCCSARSWPWALGPWCTWAQICWGSRLSVRRLTVWPGGSWSRCR